ncbi:PAX-interacting protein 1 [Pichia californica]|uniref:PAX-interacting protein 1 n=1 Tax=Pichia californica TaxID=460514 RepID=A0A9P6WKH6_9ASCO|nr:PAX-interacting protein 1 [[Candida] californica]
MSHILSHEVVELDSLLAAANSIPAQISHQQNQDLLFSDIEKQMNLSASQFTTSAHPSSNEINSENFFKVDSIPELQLGSHLQSQQQLQMVSHLQSQQQFQTTKMLRQQRQHQIQRQQQPQKQSPPSPPQQQHQQQQQVVYKLAENVPMDTTALCDYMNSELSTRSSSTERSHGILSYDSSPESNFPYTPIDSLESCTTDSTIETDLMKTLKTELLNTESLNNTVLENSKISNSEKFRLSDDLLDKQIEQIISAPINVQIDSIYSSNDGQNNQSLVTKQEQMTQQQIQRDQYQTNTLKRTIENSNNTVSYKNKKARIDENQSSDFIQENKILKCFSILRTNYLSLCTSYNEILDKLSDVETENKSLLKKIEDKENEKEEWKANKDRLYLEREDMKAMLDGLLHEVTILRRRERQSRKCSTIGEMMLTKDERN